MRSVLRFKLPGNWRAPLLGDPHDTADLVVNERLASRILRCMGKLNIAPSHSRRVIPLDFVIRIESDASAFALHAGTISDEFTTVKSFA